MTRLIAKQTIMVEGTPFKPGQELPQRDQHRVAAWVKNGAAVWAGDAHPEKKKAQEKLTAQASGKAAPDKKPAKEKLPAQATGEQASEQASGEMPGAAQE